ncbi:MAG: glycosyltransferase [Anaerolineae bacterium]|nr:glycosyltransferase [Gemmatimonadaceae bacterium]
MAASVVTNVPRARSVKVLFLVHSFPRFAEDPVGSFVLRLAVALREENVEVRVIAPGSAGLSRHEMLENVVVERYRYAPRSLETLAYTGTMRAQVENSWGARAALAGLVGASVIDAARIRRIFQPDVLHAHWWFPGGLVGRILNHFGNTPLVTTLHGSDLRLAQNSEAAAKIFRYVVRGSAALTTVSHWLAREAESIAPDSTPIVAPMPVAADVFRPGGRRSPDRLLFVGKLNAQKGSEHLLRALALMKTRATLDLVVGVGSEEKDTRKLAEALGVSDRLTWHPLLERAELARLYSEVTALVVPAIDEGLGLTAIEALLCETPVVAFASGGLTDMVIHERTGLLVPPGDHVALAQALDVLLAREDRGATLGRAGRVFALENFAPASAARRYADLYRTVVGSRHS